MWFSILFGLFLIAISLLMLIRNRTAWQSIVREAGEAGESQFHARQFRRRRQASWMMALVGVAIILGIWVTETRAAAVYWLGIVLLVCWMALLAVVDLLATRMHYSHLQRDHQKERLLLEAELKQIRRQGSNGKPKDKRLEDLE